jgi:hypothetical protein
MFDDALAFELEESVAEPVTRSVGSKAADGPEPPLTMCRAPAFVAVPAERMRHSPLPVAPVPTSLPPAILHQPTRAPTALPLTTSIAAVARVQYQSALPWWHRAEVESRFQTLAAASTSLTPRPVPGIVQCDVEYFPTFALDRIGASCFLGLFASAQHPYS